jgi:hypothetical protein
MVVRARARPVTSKRVGPRSDTPTVATHTKRVMGQTGSRGTPAGRSAGLRQVQYLEISWVMASSRIAGGSTGTNSRNIGSSGYRESHLGRATSALTALARLRIGSWLLSSHLRAPSSSATAVARALPTATTACTMRYETYGQRARARSPLGLLSIGYGARCGGCEPTSEQSDADR